ncbi:MAG TPA: hypothetical protein V6D14_29400 [Coleofasciculaceae cyanobacterium]
MKNGGTEFFSPFIPRYSQGGTRCARYVRLGYSGGLPGELVKRKTASLYQAQKLHTRPN